MNISGKDLQDIMEYIQKDGYGCAKTPLCKACLHEGLDMAYRAGFNDGRDSVKSRIVKTKCGGKDE